VNKDLGIAAKTPAAQMKSFNKKLNAAPIPLIDRLKDVWKAFAALMAGFFTIGFIIARLTIPTEAVLQTAAISPDIYDFNTFDSDGDGEWTLAETQVAKEALAIQQFEYADKNQDGKLSFEESINAVNAISQGQFIALDENGNGELSYEEVEQDIAYMDYQQFNQLDLNQDGKLNFAEAQRMFIIIVVEG
jgi:Ca2+-binding EF-hand superfamily protein